MSAAVAVYADGGVIQVNPSPQGGTWACCHVGADGQRVWEASGVILPSEVGGPVTNNQSEFMALLMALEALPMGWSGQACSDSRVTLLRFFQSGALKGIPTSWHQRMGVALGRLGQIQPQLLSGHPTRAQLVSGIGKRGTPVSIHNQWCDRRCNEEARRVIRDSVFAVVGR